MRIPMNNKKILFVANTDWYILNFRLSLANFLRSKGFDVVMASPSGKFVPEIEKQGFQWVEWGVGRKTMAPSGEMVAIWQLKNIYYREAPLLVHHFTIKPVLYGSLAARLSHVPFVVNSVTGLGYVFLSGGMKGRVLRSLVLPLYRVAFAHQNLSVIFENKNDQSIFIKNHLVSLDNSCIINGVGVNAEKFSPGPEPQHDVPVVVFPARMLLDKGLGVLIDAARLLKKKNKVRIILVGEPDPGNPATVDENQLHDWENEGIVEWWGFQKDMQKVYRSCHIVTLPSFGEGLPTVLIEAAACARPIVTTDVAGCREVVVDGVNGFLVPAGDAQALANSLEKLLIDPQLRERMGRAGREMVLDRFTDQIINQETFSVYQQIMK